jgi:transcriptional regulator with XRE-family HTH domain
MERYLQKNLRQILSDNIRFIRKALHLTQAQLAIDADISLSYLTDIERCKTWVSDKTLANIAAALHKESYQLLIPRTIILMDENTKILSREYIGDLIAQKKAELEQELSSGLDSLLAQICEA